jgi:hypothetical protein
VAKASAALRSLTRSAPVPEHGRELVEYMGGTKRATQILAGMDRGPTAAERRADPEGTRQAYNDWRAASRQAQRWAKGERGSKRNAAAELDAAQRRRAQAENRSRRRAAAGGAGIRAKLTARIIIASAGSGRRDSRHRSISNGRDGRPGVLVEGSAEIMQALADGDTELAAELLQEGYLEGAGLPEFTELELTDWDLWPDGEPEP